MAQQKYSDEQLIAALRQVAQIVGEPMSRERYEAVQQGQDLGLPMWLTISKRFGTWNEACTRAGLQVNAQHTGRPATWNPESVAQAVARFLNDPEATGASYDAYTAWSRERDDAPSGPTVRNVLGTWNNAKNAAKNL